MASDTPDSRVHLLIGSRLENVELVQIAVEAALQQLAVDDEQSHRIGTAVREAVANAIQHGNEMDPDRQVEIDFGLEGEELVIQVRDEGTGFNPGNVPDPLHPENLLRPEGRGILIMKEFMDRIEYSFHPERGTEVTLRKLLPGPREASHRQEEEE